MAAPPSDGPTRHLRLRRRWNGPGNESAQWPPPRPPVTDVREIMAGNLEQDRRAGGYRVQVRRPRRGRRLRDFLMVCAAGNGAGAGFLWWIDANTGALLIVVSGMLFFTLALAWVVFAHLDEY